MVEDSDLIQELKLEHGDIFGIELNGISFIYRALTIEEINKSTQFDDELDIEDFYVNSVLLYPANFSTKRMRAGDFKTLLEAILSVSGILDVDTVKGYLLTARERVNNDVVSVMKSYIIAAIPSYRDDELDCYTIKQLIDKVVLSEQILTLKQAVMGIQSDGVKVHIVSVDEFEQESQKPEEVTWKNKKIKKSREELLRDIRGEERETVGVRMEKPDLSSLPDDILEKVARAKEVDPTEDPIAAKLFGFE